MLNIAFRIDVGREIGLGHLTRMTALADAFREMGYVFSFFRGEDEPVDYNGFDVVILDSYQLNDEYIAGLNKKGRLVVCYDDNALYEYDCDVLINANLHAPDLVFHFGSKKPHLLLGGKYALLRQEFRKALPITVKEKASRIFVCFGGTDLRNFTPNAVMALKDIPDVKIETVIGTSVVCEGKMNELANIDNVEIHQNSKNIAEIMNKCDIAVSAAGSMVYELAALGLPALLITQADNQNRIAEYLTRHGFMKHIGDWGNCDLFGLRYETMALLSDYSRRQRESEKLMKAVNRMGSETAAREIVQLFKRNR